MKHEEREREIKKTHWNNILPKQSPECQMELVMAKRAKN